VALLFTNKKQPDRILLISYLFKLKTLFFYQKRTKNSIFQSFFSLKQAFFGQKPPQNQCKNRLFRVISGVFGVKSVPNVPSVSLVPWYGAARNEI